MLKRSNVWCSTLAAMTLWGTGWPRPRAPRTAKDVIIVIVITLL